MENNLSSGNMMPGATTFGGLDLQGSIRINHHQHPNNHQQHHHSKVRQGLMPQAMVNDVFPLTMGHSHDCEPNSIADYNKVEKGKDVLSDEDEHSFNGEGMDGHLDPSKGKKMPIWQRVKWTDCMVRLLITAVSYIGEDVMSESGTGGRRKYLHLQKKGKWKSVSKVMAERGYFVSPQQCEDKFNDLNKRYKKLNEILGRGTSCQVVEKPALLDLMDHLSEKAKDEVKKILSSKQLFYEEMCSYHNGNRLHLPHDPALQRSLQLALKSRDDNDTDSRKHSHDDVEGDDHDVETDDHEEYEDNRGRVGYEVCGDSSKRMKQMHDFDAFNVGSPLDISKGVHLHSQNQHADMNLTIPEDPKSVWRQNEWLMKSRLFQMEEQKLQIEIEKLELEKQRHKWERFCKKKDREFEKLKLENDRRRLENERMVLELKRMEMTKNCNQ